VHASGNFFDPKGLNTAFKECNFSLPFYILHCAQKELGDLDWRIWCLSVVISQSLIPYLLKAMAVVHAVNKSLT